LSKISAKFSAPVEIIKIIAKYEPLYLLFALPQMILNAILPLLYVYFPRLIIEQLTINENTYASVIKIISIYACILLFINLVNVFLKNKSGMRAITFSSKLKNEIGKIAMWFELKDIENTKVRDTIQMANKATELTDAIGIVQNVISNVITVIGLIYIIIQLDWLFILLVIVTLVIGAFFVYLRYLYSKRIRELDAENSRHGNYLYQIAWSEGGAKEIRLNNMQNWYMGKTKIYRNTMLDLQFGDFKRGTLHRIIMAIIMTLQSFVILWMLSTRYIENVITIAEFTMYFSAVATLTGSLSAISEQLGNYKRQVLNMSDYKNLMKLIDSQNNSIISEKPEYVFTKKNEIIFHDVSFSYPNTDKQILEKVKIKISDKEKLVIVGANGAGKSTFIKLLCKFYRPTSGMITLNGIDIWDIPNVDYNKVISAVFQDFRNFAFTLKENIFMGENSDIEKTVDIIRKVGLDEHISELPNTYDTYLTKNFDSSGVEFSGGQAQKIAIARAVYKNTPILILDEPTASLDPKAESEIYTNLFNMAINKTTIFISHRLTASTIADNIAVFSEGKIVEYGSHRALIKQNNIYAEMYRKQSQQYLD